jgi:hypothetical protein
MSKSAASPLGGIAMAIATSRRAPAADELIRECEFLCAELIGLKRKGLRRLSRAAAIEARLKQIAGERGESFKVTLPSGDSVEVSPARAAEFKDDVPVLPLELPMESDAACLLSKYAPSASDADRKRWCDEFAEDRAAAFIRLYAHRALGVPLWGGVENVACKAIDLFRAISPEICPTASHRDQFVKTLEIFYALTGLVAGHQHVDFMRIELHNGLVAMSERAAGFDEPLFRRTAKSSQSRRERTWVRHFKRWVATVCRILISEFELNDLTAADKVAKYIDDHKLLPRKRNGRCVVAKSILNWTAAELDLWRRQPSQRENLFDQLTIWDDYEYLRPHVAKSARLLREGSRDAAIVALMGALKELSHLKRNQLPI